MTVPKVGFFLVASFLSSHAIARIYHHVALPRENTAHMVQAISTARKCSRRSTVASWRILCSFPK